MPLRIVKDATPTRPHIDAEDGLVRGDYAILKLALERAEAECARLRGLIAALPCFNRWTTGWTCEEARHFKSDKSRELCATCKAKEAANG